MLNPMATAYDGTYDRLTRTDTGERLYANVHHCMMGGGAAASVGASMTIRSATGWCPP